MFVTVDSPITGKRYKLTYEYMKFVAPTKVAFSLLVLVVEVVY